METKCIRCGSKRIIEFIDGFGDRRIFCRDCFISLDKNSFIKLNLMEVEFNPYLKQWNRIWNVKR